MMPSRVLIAIVLLIGVSITIAEAQRRPRPVVAKAVATAKPREIGGTAVVMDETLSVLRMKPSLFAEPVQRMRRGRKVQILGVADADGVKFYRVSAPPNNSGWVQAVRPSESSTRARTYRSVGDIR